MKVHKHILILSRTDDREEYDTQQSMVRSLCGVENQAATYTGANFEDLMFRFDGNTLTITNAETNTDIAEYDFVFFIGWFKTAVLEDIASAVARYLDYHQIPFLNSEILYTRSRSKISQYVASALNGIATIPFMFALDQNLMIQKMTEEKFHTPFIAKRINASRGEDNHLLEEPSQLTEILNTGKFEKPPYFVIQQFIPNDGDYRILVVGGTVEMVIHRKAGDGTHLNNTSKGGVATLVDVNELPAKMLEDSIKMSRLLRREITGVDMIVHKVTQCHYMLEINNMPQLSTGAKVEDKALMLDSFFEKQTDTSIPIS